MSDALLIEAIVYDEQSKFEFRPTGIFPFARTSGMELEMDQKACVDHWLSRSENCKFGR